MTTGAVSVAPTGTAASDVLYRYVDLPPLLVYVRVDRSGIIARNRAHSTDESRLAAPVFHVNSLRHAFGGTVFSITNQSQLNIDFVSQLDAPSTMNVNRGAPEVLAFLRSSTGGPVRLRIGERSGLSLTTVRSGAVVVMNSNMSSVTGVALGLYSQMPYKLTVVDASALILDRLFSEFVDNATVWNPSRVVQKWVTIFSTSIHVDDASVLFVRSNFVTSYALSFASSIFGVNFGTKNVTATTIETATLTPYWLGSYFSSTSASAVAASDGLICIRLALNSVLAVETFIAGGDTVVPSERTQAVAFSSVVLRPMVSSGQFTSIMNPLALFISNGSSGPLLDGVFPVSLSIQVSNGSRLLVKIASLLNFSSGAVAMAINVMGGAWSGGLTVLVTDRSRVEVTGWNTSAYAVRTIFTPRDGGPMATAWLSVVIQTSTVSAVSSGVAQVLHFVDNRVAPVSLFPTEGGGGDAQEQVVGQVVLLAPACGAAGCDVSIDLTSATILSQSYAAWALALSWSVPTVAVGRRWLGTVTQPSGTTWLSVASSSAAGVLAPLQLSSRVKIVQTTVTAIAAMSAESWPTVGDVRSRFPQEAWDTFEQFHYAARAAHWTIEPAHRGTTLLPSEDVVGAVAVDSASIPVDVPISISLQQFHVNVSDSSIVSIAQPAVPPSFEVRNVTSLPNGAFNAEAAAVVFRWLVMTRGRYWQPSTAPSGGLAVWLDVRNSAIVSVSANDSTVVSWRQRYDDIGSALCSITAAAAPPAGPSPSSQGGPATPPPPELGGAVAIRPLLSLTMRVNVTDSRIVSLRPSRPLTSDSYWWHMLSNGHYVTDRRAAYPLLPVVSSAIEQAAAALRSCRTLADYLALCGTPLLSGSSALSRPAAWALSVLNSVPLYSVNATAVMWTSQRPSLAMSSLPEVWSTVQRQARVAATSTTIDVAESLILAEAPLVGLTSPNLLAFRRTLDDAFLSDTNEVLGCQFRSPGFSSPSLITADGQKALCEDAVRGEGGGGGWSSPAVAPFRNAIRLRRATRVAALLATEIFSSDNSSSGFFTSSSSLRQRSSSNFAELMLHANRSSQTSLTTLLSPSVSRPGAPPSCASGTVVDIADVSFDLLWGGSICPRMEAIRNSYFGGGGVVDGRVDDAAPSTVPLPSPDRCNPCAFTAPVSLVTDGWLQLAVPRPMNVGRSAVPTGGLSQVVLAMFVQNVSCNDSLASWGTTPPRPSVSIPSRPSGWQPFISEVFGPIGSTNPWRPEVVSPSTSTDVSLSLTLPASRSDSRTRTWSLTPSRTERPKPVEQTASQAAAAVGLVAGSVSLTTFVAGGTAAFALSRTVGATSLADRCAQQLNPEGGPPGVSLDPTSPPPPPPGFPTTLMPGFAIQRSFISGSNGTSDASWLLLAPSLAYHRGSFVANNFIVPVCFVALGAVLGGVVTLVKSKLQAAAEGKLPTVEVATASSPFWEAVEQYKRGCAALRFPGVTIVVLGIGLDGAVAAAAALAAAGEWPFLGVQLVTLLLLFGGCVVVISRRPVGFDDGCDRGGSSDGGIMSMLLKGIRHLVLGRGAWHPITGAIHLVGGRSPSDVALWMQRWGHIFGKCRGPDESLAPPDGSFDDSKNTVATGTPSQPLSTVLAATLDASARAIAVCWVLVDIFGTALAAGLRGAVEPGPNSIPCVTAVRLTVALNSLLLLLAVAVRPFNAPLKNAFLIVTNGLLTISASLLLSGNTSLSSSIAQASSVAASCSVGVIIVGRLLWVYDRFGGRRTRRAAKDGREGDEEEDAADSDELRMGTPQRASDAGGTRSDFRFDSMAVDQAAVLVQVAAIAAVRDDPAAQGDVVAPTSTGATLPPDHPEAGDELSELLISGGQSRKGDRGDNNHHIGHRQMSHLDVNSVDDDDDLLGRARTRQPTDDDLLLSVMTGAGSSTSQGPRVVRRTVEGQRLFDELESMLQGGATEGRRMDTAVPRRPAFWNGDLEDL